MIKPSIYYIEDHWPHFKSISEILGTWVNVFPSVDDYEEEITWIRLYLQRKNKRNEEKVIENFRKYNASLFMIDVDLFGMVNGGPRIHKNVLMERKEFEEKIFLFLTVIPKTEVMGSANTHYHLKPEISSGLDYQRLGKELGEKIKNLLHIKPIGLGDFIKKGIS